MPVLRVVLKSVEARRGKLVPDFRVENSIRLKSVKERDLKIAGFERCLSFGFEFSTKYVAKGKKVATIKIEGEVLFVGKREEIETIKSDWKRKRLSGKLAEQILNAALTEAQIMAIIIARQLFLPLPIPLPRVRSVPIPREIG